MKYIRKLIPIIILILFLISMIVYSDVVIKSVSFAVTLCINNLFPSMLPFLILSSILSNYGFVELVSHILSPLMRNLFHINSNCAYILILSMLSGSPSNAKYIKELLDSNKITTGDANKVLLFSHFVNPIFIIGSSTLSPRPFPIQGKGAALEDICPRRAAGSSTAGADRQGQAAASGGALHP